MKSRPHSFLLVLALVLSAAVIPPFAPAQTPGDYRMKVDVNLVLVPTHVMSPTGEPVTDLTREAFEIYENGQLQPLAVFEKQTALPLQLVLMIDTSLSTFNVLHKEQQAAAQFLREVLRPQDLAAVYEFSGSVFRRGGFTRDVASLEKELQQLEPRAGTALYDAIVEVARDLQRWAGRRVLVIVSDGTDTTSRRDFQTAMRAAQDAEVALYSLVVRPISGESGRNMRGERVLMAFAEMTGGQIFWVENMDELVQTFRQLSDLLRTQYLLGYHAPAHTGSNDFHRIEVRVQGGEYVVRHRRGYWHRPE